MRGRMPTLFLVPARPLNIMNFTATQLSAEITTSEDVTLMEGISSGILEIVRFFLQTECKCDSHIISIT